MKHFHFRMGKHLILKLSDSAKLLLFSCFAAECLPFQIKFVKYILSKSIFVINSNVNRLIQLSETLCFCS